MRSLTRRHVRPWTSPGTGSHWRKRQGRNPRFVGVVISFVSRDGDRCATTKPNRLERERELLADRIAQFERLRQVGGARFADDLKQRLDALPSLPGSSGDSVDDVSSDRNQEDEEPA